LVTSSFGVPAELSPDGSEAVDDPAAVFEAAPLLRIFTASFAAFSTNLFSLPFFFTSSGAVEESFDDLLLSERDSCFFAALAAASLLLLAFLSLRY
jgi:hypothetical protein